MNTKSDQKSSEKTTLHPRNPHRFQYDFKALVKDTFDLKQYVGINKYGNESIDFTNPEAVKMLNKAILKHFYKIQYWDIPPNYLCPPIPGRADYIHYLADLLADGENIPTGKYVRGLDIGMGANCVYPIIGHQSYGWSFVGSDVDAKAIESAQRITSANPTLAPFVECRLQSDSSNIFKDIVLPTEKFDFTLCNPPFHASLKEAMEGTKRKWKNLGRQNAHQKQALNFGGQNSELWYPGGEGVFLGKMVEQSIEIAEQCMWFTSLVSKKTTLPRLYQSLKLANASDVRTIEMEQGQKVSRIVAWTFLSKEKQKQWKINDRK